MHLDITQKCFRYTSSRNLSVWKFEKQDIIIIEEASKMQEKY